MPASTLATEQFTLDVSSWLNSAPVSIESLRGRVVVIETFQMLCPGCISHGLPLAQRIHRTFDRDEVVVLGLHTVFEHHAVMGREALEVFLSEYRINFPVAIDRPVPGQAIPATMQRYGLRGTPSMLIIDRDGRLRDVTFGAVDELALGARLGRLLAESPSELSRASGETISSGPAFCDIDGNCA
ncbi:peroxiredoxin family protein [Microbacterium sp. CGR1]|uniref:peroxiredoxin family protein n=1 Tax=Microbacterium sp. CGR1 TaxID=1696072 RepID=UPI003DA4EA2E